MVTGKPPWNAHEHSNHLALIFKVGRRHTELCSFKSITHAHLKHPFVTLLSIAMKLCLYLSLLVCLRAIFKWESNLIRDCMFWLCYALWLIKKTRAILSTNQMQKWKQSRLGHSRLPVFQTICFILSYYGRTACVFFGTYLDHHCLFFFLRSQWPSPHPTYQRALTQLFEMCSWGVLNQSLTRDRLLRNSLDIHSLLKCERKLATSIFFSLNSVNLNYSSEAVSFINAAHSDISPTCDRVVSLDPELVKIFRKVITLCVTSACLNAERQSWIQEFFDWRVWSLIHFFFSYTRAWISEINVSTLEI